MPEEAAPSSRELDLTRQAIDHVRSEFAPRDASISFLPDSDVQTTSAGVHVVHLHQEVRGVRIHGGSVAVHFDSEGRIEVVGEVRAVPRDLQLTPQVPVADAVLAAARHVVAQLGPKRELIPLKLSNRPPVQLGRFEHPSNPTMVHKPPFKDPVTARLTLYGANLRLAWEVHLRLPRGLAEWTAIVAADEPNAPRILHAWSSLAHAVQGLVFEFNPKESVRTLVPFPCPRTRYPEFFGRALPPGHDIWVSDDQTRGNNVICLRDRSKRSYAGKRSGDEVLFVPSDDAGTDQRMLNAFYITNFLHDFFFFLGFDEAAGNFQSRNLGGLRGDDDRLVIRVFDSVIAGMATMRSYLDGTSPELNLGLRGKRHTALDADIVIHEYVHGVTNRLVGGPHNEDPLRRHEQSKAMAEGYSDYFALTILNFYRRQASRAERWVFGEWIGDNPATGLRRHAYGPGFPETYATLKTTANLEWHDAGQVWGEALLRFNRLVAGADKDLGDQVGWQLVTDSLKLLPIGERAPMFLDGRDALLRAFDDRASTGLIPDNAAMVRAEIITMFANLGMGPAAASRGAMYNDVVAAFT